MAKDNEFKVRVAAETLAKLKQAAARCGLSLSAWVTDRLLRAARAEMKEDER